MEINYKKEMIDLLKKNKIYHLPPKELIISDEEISLAVWNSFDIENYDYDFGCLNWYKEGNWKNNFDIYEKNIEFWRKAFISNENVYPVLLAEEFEKDFPLIKESLLKDKEILINAFFNTLDENFFNLIEASEEEKNEIFKNFILQNPQIINADNLIKYSSDIKFMNKLLDINLYNFRLFPYDARSNHEIIMNALKDRSNFFNIAKEKRLFYINFWVEKNIDATNIKISDFTKEEIPFVLEDRPALLSGAKKFLEHNVYKECVIKSFNKNLYKTAEVMDNNIMDILKEDNNILLIKDSLEEFVSSYKKVNKLATADLKIISLISLNEDLFNKLRNNFYYKISEIEKGKLNLSDLKELFKVVRKDIDDGMELSMANKILSNAKEKLSIDLLKQHKISDKDIYSILEILVLKDKLDEDLEKRHAVVKNKI